MYGLENDLCLRRYYIIWVRLKFIFAIEHITSAKI